MMDLESALTFLADNWIPVFSVLATTSVLDIVLTRLFSASVKYKCYMRPSSTPQMGPPLAIVVLKNMEASEIPGSDKGRVLRLLLTPGGADTRIVQASVAAGPWLTRVARQGNGVAITLRGFPAEAALSFLLELSAQDQIHVDWAKDSVGVAPLAPLRERFSGPRALVHSSEAVDLEHARTVPHSVSTASSLAPSIGFTRW